MTLGRSESHVHPRVDAGDADSTGGLNCIPWPLYRMSLEQYESLIASGFFAKHDDVHLINGYVVNRMAESPEHGFVCDAHPPCDRGDPWPRRLVCPRPERPEDPFAGQHPVPDLAVVRGTPRDYLKRYPEATEAALVVEVSLSSLEEDRAMADIYAAGGIPVYWIVDVDDGQVEVYADPGHRLSVTRGPLTGPCAARRHRRRRDPRDPGVRPPAMTGLADAQAHPQAIADGGGPGDARGPVRCR